MIKLIAWCKPYAKYILIAWLITVITVSSIPSLPTLKIHTPSRDIRLDYLIHFCEYGFMAIMTYLAFADRLFRINNSKWILLTAALIAFALMDELHQKFIPGRTYNIRDFISNVTGIIAALLLCIYIFNKINRRRRHML